MYSICLYLNLRNAIEIGLLCLHDRGLFHGTALQMSAVEVPLVGFSPISPDIFKKTISKLSSLAVKPNSTATIEYSIYSINGSDLNLIDTTLHRKSPLKVTLGSGMILRNLETAILSMTQGEKSQFYMQDIDLISRGYFEKVEETSINPQEVKKYRVDI